MREHRTPGGRGRAKFDRYVDECAALLIHAHADRVDVDALIAAARQKAGVTLLGGQPTFCELPSRTRRPRRH